jgi:hypothetical protein
MICVSFSHGLFLAFDAHFFLPMKRVKSSERMLDPYLAIDCCWAHCASAKKHFGPMGCTSLANPTTSVVDFSFYITNR